MGKSEAKSSYKHFVQPVKEQPEWFKNFNFILIESMEDLETSFKDWGPGKTFIAVDTETNDLDAENLELVGYSYCMDGKNAYYVPINHFNYEHNLGEPAVKYIYDRMCESKMTFMYNVKFDARVFEFRGFKDLSEEDKKKRFLFINYDMSKVPLFDVMDCTWLSDTNIKMPSLKHSSEHFLGFRQVHFDEVTEGAENFYYVHPKDATFYAASDALCTYLLVPVTMRYFKESGLAGKVDQKVIYPLMHYEHEKFYLDKELLEKSHAEATAEVERLEKSIYDNLGFQINLNSPAQISQAFMRLGIDTGQRTATGNMKTGTEDLEKLPDYIKEKYPALKALVQYKSMYKLNNTYFSVLAKIAQEKGYTRGAYKMFNVPTGRLAAGKDSKNTFFSPVNLQALPKPHVAMYDVFDTGIRDTYNRDNLIINGFKFVMSKYDNDGNHIIPDDPTYIGWAEGMNPHLNVRACFLPLMYEDSNPDEWLYIAIDYAAQELRIPANLSREPVWVDAFTTPGGDVHKRTAISIWGEENYNKDYRKMAKVANFGILYGMGANSFAENPMFHMNMAQAEEFMGQYKNALPTLFQWEDRLMARGRRDGTVYTFFGRPRRVKGYFDNRQIAFANRTIVNTTVQGTASDLLKIVMCKLWDKVLNNPEYRDDVAFRVTIHDEIGYSLRANKLNTIGKLVQDTMTVKLDQWPVSIETELSAGYRMGQVWAFEFSEEEQTYKPKLD